MSTIEIDDAQIEAFRSVAVEAGDDAMVRLCDAALDETRGQQAAWARREVAHWLDAHAAHAGGAQS